jgi:hypothetical protein
MGQMIMCTSCMSNYYLCDFFRKIIDNEKIEESDETHDYVYILHVKRYAIMISSGLER